MSSLKLPETVFGSGGTECVYEAVSDIAERCFFSLIDPCDSDRFVEIAALHADWLMATVRFDDGVCQGSVVCCLPMALAARLFDAFSGRDADDPAPDSDDVLDLMGEFVNMIGGAWLTRAANQRTFTLSPPDVVPVPLALVTAADRLLLVSIEDLPCSVDISVETVPATVAGV